jgi:penicillin-binding protein 2
LSLATGRKHEYRVGTFPLRSPAADVTTFQTRARRKVKLRDMPLVEPISGAGAPFHRSAGFYVRVGALGVGAVAVIGVLVLRAWSLQVLQGPAYAHLATRQAYRTVDLPGPRGAIIDRKGRLLAGIDGRLAVTADRMRLGRLDAHGRWSPTPFGLRALALLARVSHIPRAVLVRRIQRAILRSPYAPAVVLPRPTRALAFYIAERPLAFHSFHIIALPSRSYPEGGLGSEFLGLLGEIGPKQLGSKLYGAARRGEVVGQSGVEAVYDRKLNGGFVRARLPVDSRGDIVGPLRVRPHGKALPTLKLTIDARLQRVAMKAIQDGIAFAHRAGHPDARAGAAVVMNPWTGAVYALASYPDYNQGLAARDPGYLSRLLRSDPRNTPLLDRATQGVYPTGSTFKPITAEAALSAGLITPSTPLLCSGSFTLGGTVFRNVEAGVYTTMTLPTALAQSCDTWFYRVGDIVYASNPARQGTLIQQWAAKLGLGSRTGIDVTGESAGVVPTPTWFARTQHYPWTEGQTINLAIGQGALQVTPLQLAVAYSALANGGTVVTPHVGDEVIGADGGYQLRFRPRRHVHLPDIWAIRQGLFAAAHDPAGTSSAVFANFPVPVAGKTGTAEAPPGSDHSWYASWAPAGHPRIVVVVLIEHGGFGAEAAAPAAREIYSAFFHVKNR